jgi:hypothetical protein
MRCATLAAMSPAAATASPITKERPPTNLLEGRGIGEGLEWYFLFMILFYSNGSSS